MKKKIFLILGFLAIIGITGFTAYYLGTQTEYAKQAKAEKIENATKSLWKTLLDNPDINEVEKLIKDGANVKSIVKGASMLQLAIMTNLSPEIIELFIKNGANVNETFENDTIGTESLLSASLMLQNPQVAKLLIQHGANVNNVDSLGFSPLSLAISSNQIDIAEMLLKNGADINRRFDLTMPGRGKIKNLTELHLSCINGKIEIAKLLIQYGADINAKDEFGRTPLDYIKNDSELREIYLSINKKRKEKKNFND